MAFLILLVLLVGSLASRASQSQEVGSSRNHLTREQAGKSSTDNGGVGVVRLQTAVSKPVSTPPILLLDKRPIALDSLKIIGPDAPLKGTQQQLEPKFKTDASLPNFLTILEMEGGQTLQLVPDDPIKDDLAAYGLDRPQLEDAIRSAEQEYHKRKKVQSQARNLLTNSQLLEIIGADRSVNTNGNKKGQPTFSVDVEELLRRSASNEGRNSGGHWQQQQQPQRHQQHQIQQQTAIDVGPRNMQSGLGSVAVNLPKAYISSLLFGRPTSVLVPSLAVNFNKKAEPKENVFMHFGRK